MRKSTLWIIVSFLMSLSVGGHAGLRADINHDGRVNMQDLAILASEWMMEDADMNLGPELIQKGDFGDGVELVWIKTDPCAWTFSDNRAIWEYQEGYGDTTIFQDVAGIVAGKRYRVQFTLNFLAESGLSLYFAGESSEQYVGLYQADTVIIWDMIAGAELPRLEIIGSGPAGSVMSVDNVSLREILPDDDITPEAVTVFSSIL